MFDQNLKTSKPSVRTLFDWRFVAWNKIDVNLLTFAFIDRIWLRVFQLFFSFMAIFLWVYKLLNEIRKLCFLIISELLISQCYSFLFTTTSRFSLTCKQKEQHIGPTQRQISLKGFRTLFYVIWSALNFKLRYKDAISRSLILGKQESSRIIGAWLSISPKTFAAVCYLISEKRSWPFFDN